jgi:hypothetical protein
VQQKKKAPGKSSTLTPVPSSDAVGPDEDEEVKAEEDPLEGSFNDSVNAGLPSPETSSANGVVGKQTLESGSQTPSRRVSHRGFSMPSPLNYFFLVIARANVLFSVVQAKKAVNSYAESDDDEVVQPTKRVGRVLKRRKTLAVSSDEDEFQGEDITGVFSDDGLYTPPRSRVTVTDIWQTWTTSSCPTSRKMK